ncbi:hypothetical protein NUW54_g11957 [Trametes sanguinea]|uniref:Uncharacterized protein n=1 Tax=Trametes sanguinea TaxID=158606 RepID=A0ACC1N562_9APHY|nr:hypothetical protein NUW54_g11957 [Trametes sanguinea]
MAAFTVKATYHNETRKFSFADASFPTFEQLYKQHPFSCIESSPSPTLSIYLNSCSLLMILSLASSLARRFTLLRSTLVMLRLIRRPWPGALLRFSVFDETPHKSPRLTPSDTLLGSPADASSVDVRASILTESDGADHSSAATVVEPAAEERKHDQSLLHGFPYDAAYPASFVSPHLHGRE